MKKNIPTITLLFPVIFVCFFQQIYGQEENEKISVLESNPYLESDADDEEFKIVFDLEEIYPLVDYDTICTDYEIQDFIDNQQATKEAFIIHSDTSGDLCIPDVPQMPESITLVDIASIEEFTMPIPASVNIKQEKTEIDESNRNRKKKKERLKLSKHRKKNCK